MLSWTRSCGGWAAVEATFGPIWLGLPSHRTGTVCRSIANTTFLWLGKPHTRWVGSESRSRELWDLQLPA